MPRVKIQFENLISFSILPLTSIFIFYNLFKIRFSCILLLLLLIDWFIVFNATFRNIMAISFGGGGSRREPPTMDRQLVSLITCGCESSALFLLFTKSNANPHCIGDRLVWVVRARITFAISVYRQRKEKKKWKRYDKYWILIRYTHILWSCVSVNLDILVLGNTI